MLAVDPAREAVYSAFLNEGAPDIRPPLAEWSPRPKASTSAGPPESSDEPQTDLIRLTVRETGWLLPRRGRWRVGLLSGTTGYDYETMTMPDGVEAQARNTFATIQSVLAEAGASMADIVRVHYYITKREDAAAVMTVAGEVLGDIRPAATLLICDCWKRRCSSKSR
jgi:hypothetical protein